MCDVENRRMSTTTRTATVALSERHVPSPLISTITLLAGDRLCRPLTAEELRIIQSGEPVEDIVAV
jgi:hypothetical protein